MDRDLVTTFTDELIADEFSRIPDYFREVGTPMPKIKWSPEASDLAEEALRVHTTSWDRLILPLKGEDGTISRLLVGNVPGEWAAHR